MRGIRVKAHTAAEKKVYFLYSFVSAAVWGWWSEENLNGGRRGGHENYTEKLFGTTTSAAAHEKKKKHTNESAGEKLHRLEIIMKISL